MAKDDDKISGTYEAPHSTKPKNGSKEAGRDAKDQLGPFVPNMREYYAGVALSGIAANAALHRAGNAAALACQLAEDMVIELNKPPVLPDEELKQQLLEKRAEEEEKRREEREAREEADRKSEKEQREREAKEREKAEKVGAKEREQPRPM